MLKYSSTKKGNSRRNSIKSVVGWLFLGAIGLVFTGWVFSYVVVGLVALFWQPIDATRVWLSQSGDTFPTYIRDRNELNQQIQQLQMKLASEQGSEQTVRKLLIENEQFRTLLGAVPDERILARVVARPNQLPYDVLMIDRGSDHGIVADTVVFTGKDQVVGIVTKVLAQTSFVTLITAPELVTSVYVVGPNIYTFAEGVGGGLLRVRVPQGIEIQSNQLVLLPAVDSGVVGTIEKVVTTPTNPERLGYITLAEPLQSLQYVSVARAPLVTPSFADVQAAISKRVAELLTVDVPDDILVTPETVVPAETETATGTENVGIPETLVVPILPVNEAGDT